MNIPSVRLSIFITCLGFLVACNNSSKEKKLSDTDTTAKKEDTGVTPPPANEKDASPAANKTDYPFDEVVTLTGTIGQELFYGSPGFGENPATDAKEERYLLLLTPSVNFIGDNVSEEESEDESRRTRKNVSKIQLMYEPGDIDMGKYLGSKVRLTGTFFGAHTGHHHTEVIMTVTKVEQ